MSLRLKTYLSFLILLFIIIGLVGTGIELLKQQVNTANEKRNNNYRHISLSREMINALEEINTTFFEIATSEETISPSERKKLKSSLYSFSENAEEFQKIIREESGKDLIIRVQESYRNYLFQVNNALDKSALTEDQYHDNILPSFKMLREHLNHLFILNLNSLEKIEDKAEDRVDNFILIFSFAGLLAIIFTIVIIVFFSRRIYNPLVLITEKMDAISHKEYDQKIQVNSKDEVGKLSSQFNFMASRLREYENLNIEQIIKARRRAEEIIEAIDNPIFLLDENNRIIMANKKARQLSGKDLPKLSEIVVHPSKEILLDIIPGSSIRKSFINEVQCEVLEVNNNPNPKIFEKTSFPIFSETKGNPGKTLIGYLILLKDTTRYRQLEEAKNIFIERISHEVRTPLSAINLSLKLLKDPRIGKMNNEQENLIEILQKDIQRLLKLTGQVLENPDLESHRNKKES